MRAVGPFLESMQTSRTQIDYARCVILSSFPSSFAVPSGLSSSLVSDLDWFEVCLDRRAELYTGDIRKDSTIDVRNTLSRGERERERERMREKGMSQCAWTTFFSIQMLIDILFHY